MWELGGGGIEKKGKRTHGCGPQCGDCGGARAIRGLNDNRKNTIKIKFLKVTELILLLILNVIYIFFFPPSGTV